MFVIEPNREPAPRRIRDVRPSRPVRKQMLPITIDEAAGRLAEAGYQPTSRSRGDRLHVQQKWNRAATIRPVPGGVVVKPAWTTAQVVVVLGALVLLFGGLCWLPGAALIVV